MRGRVRCRSASPVLATVGAGAPRGGLGPGRAASAAPFGHTVRPRTALPSQFYAAKRNLLAEQEAALQRAGSPQCQAMARLGF